MTTTIAINGFGRMGRLVLRAAWDRPDLKIVHINECAGDAAMSAHLLEFDSVHGRWSRDISAGDQHIEIEGQRIGYSSNSELNVDNWKNIDADIVLECTGEYRTPGLLQPYFDAGLRKVIVAAPVKTGALNVVFGLNHKLYDSAKHQIITAASCTTNCLAPVVHVIHQGLGIRHGLLTTIHDVTNTQVVVDKAHKDPRRARSCLNSLIPTSTGSATAVTMIIPELAGKLNGLAVRVPLLNASLTDVVFEVKRPTTTEEVNALFKKASEGELKGILGYEERPLVSADYTNDIRSGIVDAGSTLVNDGTQIKVLVWYDNEIGYVNRMAELTSYVAERL